MKPTLFIHTIGFLAFAIQADAASSFSFVEHPANKSKIANNKYFIALSLSFLFSFSFRSECRRCCFVSLSPSPNSFFIDVWFVHFFTSSLWAFLPKNFSMSFSPSPNGCRIAFASIYGRESITVSSFLFHHALRSSSGLHSLT